PMAVGFIPILQGRVMPIICDPPRPWLRAPFFSQMLIARFNLARDGTMVAPGEYLQVVIEKH
ncbi:MAG TPA: hypothetical protein VEM35_02365, partial [Rhizomicrobium sp.]|nr:hypothetical protein [Rhizomicrobium sp.]